MTVTSLSLLDRIQGDPRSERWQEFMDFYSPMIVRWLLAHGVREQDREEILQEVCTVLVRRLPDFERRRDGSFRRWLRLTTTNCLRDFWKRSRRQARGHADSKVDQMLNALADDASGPSRLWEREHNHQLLAILLDRIRPEFRTATWQAFTLVTLQQIAPNKVAAQLGISTNAVFIAKSRVMKRMREEGSGLLDI